MITVPDLRIPSNVPVSTQQVLREIYDQLRNLANQIPDQSTLASQSDLSTAVSTLQTQIKKAANFVPLYQDTKAIMRPAGGSHAAGAAPDPGNASGYDNPSQYLREDAKWTYPISGLLTDISDIDGEGPIKKLSLLAGLSLLGPLMAGGGIWTDRLVAEGYLALKFPAWILFNSQDQTAGTSSTLTSAFDTTTFDNFNLSASGLVTFKQPGLVLTGFQGKWAGSTGGTIRNVSILHNNSNSITVDSVLPATTTTVRCSCTVLTLVAAGDNLSAQALQDSGGNLAFQTSATTPLFWGVQFPTDILSL